MLNRLAIAFLLVSLCAGLNAVAATGTVSVPADGATLATDYYLPAGAGPFPVILNRTPYGKISLAGEATKWVGYGYAFVAQDMRGTGGSTDTAAQRFECDGWGPKNDSLVAVNWILAQSWCNGKIGTLGFSAPGAESMLASGASSLLTTQIIENAPASFYGQWTYQGGVLKSELASAASGWDNAGKWAQHPSYDAFWAYHDETAIAAQIVTPAIHFTSWFDMFLQGGIDGFMARQYNGGAGGLGKQHLIIDPTTHDGGMGQLTFPGKDLSPGRTSTRRAFDDYYMKGTGTGLDYTVKYYSMGAVGETGAPGNEWRTADAWPPFPTTDRKVYLAPSSMLTTAPPTGSGTSLTYTFDPLNPVPTVGGANLDYTNNGPKDQRSVSSRADVLKFQTAPLTAPLEVTGHVTVKLYVSSTAVDTDFTAKMVDIYPDGREMLFLDSIQRVKYRDSFTTPSSLPVGTVGEITIDLWSTSLTFNTGHRIGVQVSSSNASRFEVNANTGADHPTYSGTTIVPSSVATAQNTVYFAGAAYPSALIIPVDSSLDSDSDGLNEAAEASAGTDPNNADTDGDGYSDGDEVNTYHTNPLVADTDTDGDGLSNNDETNTYHTDPLIADTDGDRLSDGEEVNIYHTDPLLPDTDGDGYSDGLEVSLGSNPTDPTTTMPATTTLLVLCGGIALMLFGAKKVRAPKRWSD